MDYLRVLIEIKKEQHFYYDVSFYLLRGNQILKKSTNNCTKGVKHFAKMFKLNYLEVKIKIKKG